MKNPHIPILRAFDELKFSLGKKTLIDFLKGDENPTIDRNNLDSLESYGCLYMLETSEITQIVDQMIMNNFLSLDQVKTFKVVNRTIKGVKEIYEKKWSPQTENAEGKVYSLEESEFTQTDEKLLENFEFFLKDYNKEQKKAIVCPKNNILCVAGAGSGKTTVLTKRIEFLNKFAGVKEKEILAITFTRKAKEEMKHRLEKLEIFNVKVETFNSFCEKILRRNESKIYEKKVRIASFRDKIRLVNSAFEKLNTSLDSFAQDYFNKRQLREKTKDELFFSFVGDIFSIMDSYKNRKLEVDKFYELSNKFSEKKVAMTIYEICKFIEKKLKSEGMRDFSDQILDVINFFERDKEEIPRFKHILIDEFQDVNLPQMELLKLLNPENIFAVGDPRQAIYGWRGSDINFILNFPKEFEDSEIIILKKNYRSTKKIIEFSNLAIKPMKLKDLESVKENTADCVHLCEHKNEDSEKMFITQAIKASKAPREEIFVLARTNRQLDLLIEYFQSERIAYTIKQENREEEQKLEEGRVVLATVHAIKGMEATEVYLMGANSLSFPNKVVDNFVFQLVKDGEDYDKEAEELRLFYVAVTRAKEKLVISYTGNLTKFITTDMLMLFAPRAKKKTVFDYETLSKVDKSNFSDSMLIKNMLKNWRSEKSNSMGGLPSYMIISNKAIEELAVLRPSSKVELLNINGLGEVKIAKYGDEILKILNG
ncbi:MAG: UvrD-helicase domain-containing protein [Nanoarchaeota archaeon]